MAFIILAILLFVAWKVTRKGISFSVTDERLESTGNRLMRATKVVILALAMVIVMGYFFAVKWGGVIIFSKMSMGTVSVLAIIAVGLAILTAVVKVTAITRKGYQ